MRNARIPMTCMIVLALATAAGGCKKKGGGGWLVGERGLMEAVDGDGQVIGGYAIDGEKDLGAITCAEGGTAYVVGAGGTFLRTLDGGETWTIGALGTTAALREVAAALRGVVIVAGADGLYRSDDAGAHWRVIGAGGWRAVAVDPEATLLLGLDDAGRLWRGEATGALAQVAEVTGAAAIAMAEIGTPIWVTGAATAWRSTDGSTWTANPLGTALDVRDAAVTADGGVLAVGSGGAVARVAPTGAVTTSIAAAVGLDAVHLDDDGVGFAGGELGTLLGTDDDGATWTLLDHSGLRILDLDQVDRNGRL